MRKKLFPENNYTPFGYLDNPHHCWIINPSGVLRTVAPLGFAFYFPDYGQWEYVAGMNFNFTDTDKNLNVSSHYHSKNLFSYNVEISGIEAEFLYFLDGENSLVCQTSFKNVSTDNKELILTARVFLRIKLKKSKRWEFGVTGRYVNSDNSVMLRSYAEGITVVFSSDLKPFSWRIDGMKENVNKVWKSKYDENNLMAFLKFRIAITPGKTKKVNFKLTRGYQLKKIISENRISSGKIKDDIKQKMNADNQFWRNCPVIEGDFPEFWKRGWVYDWETLRMCIRNPAGIFKHRWDAMQIQIPRVVLAETSLDSLMYSYADLKTSREVILGTFIDAPSPQIPCVREDGSPNMVAEDGSECGTSPAWCWPFYCILLIYKRCYDKDWLKKLYPFLEKYINWWLCNRYKESTGIFYKCSWESGQDSSLRFGRYQPSGGELIENISPVDLNVAFAQACSIMEFFSGEIGINGKKWSKIGNKFLSSLRKLWTGDGYYDFDQETQRFIRIEDCTNLSPAFLKSLVKEKIDILKKKLEMIVNSKKTCLEWGSFVFQLGECALHLEKREFWTNVLYDNISRIYQYWDRRKQLPEEKLPGISLEWWSFDRPAGAEGYGWGASSPVSIIRHIFGFLENDRFSFILFPSVPEKLWLSGKSISIKNLHFQKIDIDLFYIFNNNNMLDIHLSFRSNKNIFVKVIEDDKFITSSRKAGKNINIKFKGKNFHKYRIFLLSKERENSQI